MAIPMITGFEAKDLPVLNEALRKSSKDLQDQINAISGSLSSFPVGGIIMWSGTIATIPTGWHLCDGTSGTPDIRNMFIVCADADDTGVANTTLTGSATQSGGSISHGHSGASAAHVHTVTATQRRQDTSGNQEGHAVSVTQTGSTDPAVTVNSQSAPQPYYALAYIMKL